MDRNDKIIFWFSSLLVLQTVPTWFILGWYWFDISTATIIATLVLCLSFVVRESFLERFLLYIYFIKLTNIISLIASYGKDKFPDNTILILQMGLLNYSKPVFNVILYLWFIYAFLKFVRGWRYLIN